MIKSCKEALAIGGFGPELIYKYNNESLPKLYEIINSDYDAVFEKFISISRTFLKEVKKRKPQNSLEVEPVSGDKLIEAVDIKLERKSTHEMSLRGQKTTTIATTVISLKKKRLESETDPNVDVKKQKKTSKKLVKKKKLKKQVSKMCNTTAEMVAKNQQHNTSVQSELEKPAKTKKTSIAKRAAKLKKEKRSTLASNITQNLNTVVSDLSQLSYPKPIASSSIASYSKKSEPPPQLVLPPKTPIAKKHLNVIDEASIQTSGKVKQIIEMCEARAKTPNTLVASTKKPTGLQSNKVVRNLNLQYGGSKIPGATKAAGGAVVGKTLTQENPIDKRKERLSARIEAKRQSMAKQVNALIKDSLDCLDHKAGTAEKSEAVKQEPQIPVSKRLYALNNNPSIKQNYKLMTPSSKLPTTTGVKRNSFIKFLERNTPCKMTNTDLKLDLAMREAQDQKRLEERNRQMQEKVEISKKKREEKMRKINELKAKKAEEDLRRQEEIDQKQREAELNKKRQQEEKRKERERHLAAAKSPNQAPSQATFKEQSSKIPAITQMAPPTSAAAVNRNETFKQPAQQHLEQTLNYESLSSCKSNQQQTAKTPSKHNYVLPQIIPDYKPPTQTIEQTKTPLSSFKGQNYKSVVNTSNSKYGNSTPTNNYQQQMKIKTYEDYNINDLKSEDETDDDEQPSKPIPLWAKNPQLTQKAKFQGLKMINFTKLFQASSNYNVVLEDIFKIKRRNFTERSSSANWSSPPVWKTNGITGNESFRRL